MCPHCAMAFPVRATQFLSAAVQVCCWALTLSTAADMTNACRAWQRRRAGVLRMRQRQRTGKRLTATWPLMRGGWRQSMRAPLSVAQAVFNDAAVGAPCMLQETSAVLRQSLIS